MIRIECKCQTCKANAAKVGASFPLKADVPARYWATFTTPKAITDATHSSVHIAHDPNMVSGAAVRRATGIVAVR